jgi:hypothetical protein
VFEAVTVPSGESPRFDAGFGPTCARRMRDLATLRFIVHQENLIFPGPTGIGKPSGCPGAEGECQSRKSFDPPAPE